MINLKFTPHKNGLLANQSNKAEALLRISSDLKMPTHGRKRLPLNLAVVIDRSGSMSGQPLEEAKKCAVMLVDRMNEEDRLSVVTYDNRVDVVFSSVHVSKKEELKSRIMEIRSGGSTALYDGWSVGAEQVAVHASNKCLSRVLLLSDGQANSGLTDEDVISEHCKTMAENGVTTSTYGLSEYFNENLMTRMAQAGQGQSHYGQTADDLIDPFQEEFDLLEAILARKLRLRILPEVGVNFEILNDYLQDRQGRFIMPDLAYGGDVWALLKVKITAEKCLKPIGSTIKLLSAFVDYLDVEGAENRSKTAKLKIDLCSDHAYAELPFDETVEQRSLEVRAASIQEQAQVAARAGNWVAVDSLMDELDTLGKDNEWIAASSKKLRVYSSLRKREAFSKESVYKARRMKERRVSFSEARYGLSDSASSEPSYLRRKLEQGKRQD